MKLPRSLEIMGVLLGEALRAVAVPWHALAYLLHRSLWQERARQALAAGAEHPEGPDLQRFARPPRNPPAKRHVFISAGEASGEAHAVALIAALRKAGAEPRWTCFGGPRLQNAGAELLFPLSDQEIMGITGVFKGLPLIIRSFARYLRLLDQDPPDLVILVDYPGMHLVMAAAARRRKIPVLHYIAPQYWAWAPWRMRRYRRAIDHCFTILPFEVAFFNQEGIHASYIGNPLLDALPTPAAEERDANLLCILPGSREREIHHHLPGMLEIAKHLRATHPDLRVVLPHRDPRRRDLIHGYLQAARADFVEFHSDDFHAPLARAQVVLAKSGTGSLESCLMGTPTVVIFRVEGWLHRFILRYLLNVPWFASANLIAGRQVVPEIALVDERDWDLAANRVSELLLPGAARDDCINGLTIVRQRLGRTGACERAAQWLLPFCRSD